MRPWAKGSLVWLAALAALPCAAQTVVDPARVRTFAPYLDHIPGETPLSCEVTPIRPELNFGFRYQAGYVVRVPMRQYQGEGHRWNMMVAVTPQAGDSKPVYLGTGILLPKIPATHVSMALAGGYLLGEGSYQVRFLLFDERRRACRKQWHIDVRRSFAERNVAPAMAPGTVEAFSLRGRPAPSRSGDDDRPPRRLTLLLDAAPISPRRMRLGSWDRMLLVGWVASLVERMPAGTVRLVAFNLDQQREIFRTENLVDDDLERLAQALNRLELNAVDYHVLQNRHGSSDLLADLANREWNAAAPADEVIFLGPRSRYQEKISGVRLDRPASGGPHLYYLQFLPFRRLEASLPDSIQQLMSHAGGKTFVVRTPADLARAIGQIERTSR